MTTYLPWVRTGLAGAITAADPLSGPLPVRAVFTVSGAVGPAADQSGRLDVRINGPGEVLALDSGAVIRTEPATGAQEAEPNLFCSIEFRVPDLPWLFTPAGPNGDRLRPWVVLVVAAEHAAQLEPGDGSRPGLLHVPDVRAELPDLAQSHAWAHVQIEYIAAVVPAFEAGRLAALGLQVPDATTTAPAWDASVATATDLPVFHSWRFMTGLDGDFESLVSRLKRTSLGGDTAAGRAVSVTGLPGGLPDLVDWRFPGALGLCPDPLPGSGFRTGLEELVDGVRTAAGLPVAPPLYGRWHAAVRTLAGTTKPWLARLNRDPRYRSAAALGARIVQDHQESLMVAAWQQIGAVEAANALLRQAQLAREAGGVLHATLSGLDAATLVLVTRPLHTRVLDDTSGVTIAAGVDGSRVPLAMTSSAFRRMLRPRGPLGRRAGVSASELLREVNDGTPVVPPRRPPDGIVTVDAGRGMARIRPSPGAVSAARTRSAPTSRMVCRPPGWVSSVRRAVRRCCSVPRRRSPAGFRCGRRGWACSSPPPAATCSSHSATPGARRCPVSPGSGRETLIRAVPCSTSWRPTTSRVPTRCGLSSGPAFAT